MFRPVPLKLYAGAHGDMPPAEGMRVPLPRDRGRLSGDFFQIRESNIYSFKFYFFVPIIALLY